MTKNKIIISLSIASFVFVGFSGNIAMAQTVTGSGTLNYLPLWTSTSSIGDSGIYQSSGNIGIGTTIPTNKLDLEGAAVIGATYSGAYVNAPANGLLVEGNVGIGTINPGTSLQIGDGTTAGTKHVRIDAATTNNAAFEIFKGGVTKWIMYNPPNSNDLYFYGSGSGGGDRVTFQGSGNVGIGTTAPNDQLEITGNFRLPITTSTAGVIKLGVVRFLHAYGNSNTFLGSTAGNLTMSSMGDNVGIGTNVLTANTTGYWNTSVGSRSLQANTTGYENTAIGERSLFYDTVGYQNTAAGSKTLYSNISGAGNSAFGYAALTNNSTGGGNSAFGSNALYSNSAGDRNIAVGGQAGLASSGSDNIFLGYAAGDNVYSGNNNIIIGSNLDAPSANGGNQMYLGGVIYGNLLTGNVGIGTTTPGYLLDVNGNARFTSTVNADFILNNVTAGQWTGISLQNDGVTKGILGVAKNAGDIVSASTAGDVVLRTVSTNFRITTDNGASSAVIVNAAGNVGIGTTTLASSVKLALDSGGPGTANYMSFGQGGEKTWIGSETNASRSFIVYDKASSTYRLAIDKAGNVGIGTTAPQGKLSVVGDGTGYGIMGGSTGCGGNYTGLSLNGTAFSSCTNYNLLGSATNSTFYINRPTGGAIRFRENNTDQMIIETGGNVGIGTASPSQKLEVNGGMRLNTATAKPTCDSSVRGTFWATQGTAGVKDNVEVCAKDAADSYAWRTLY